MTTIATLTVDLIAESAKFRSELKKANKSADGWSKQIKSSASTAAKSIAAVGVATATAVAAMYTVTANSIDQQAKFADKIGITTEALTSLQHAGDLTGVATNTLNMGLQRMTRRVSDAAQGTGEAVGALKELGLSAEAMNQLRPDEQFKAIADAMGGVENRSDKVRLAFKLFDSEGTALLNTLDAGADGITAMMDEAELLGIALSRVDAAKVENANDAFDKASKTSRAFSQQLTAELAPIVEGVANEFLRASIESGGMGEVATMATDAIVKGLDVVYVGLLSLKNGWNVVKWATLEAAQFGVEALRVLENDLKYFLNMLPGIEMTMSESLGSALTWLREESTAALDDMATSSEGLATQMVAVFDGTGKIQEITDRWRDAAQATAEAKAASIQYNEALNGGDAANEPAFSDKDREKMAAELARLEESFLNQTQLIELHEEQKKAQVDQWRAADVVSFQKAEELKKQIKLKASKDLAQLEAQQSSMMLQNSSKMFGDMADLSKTFAGEQSGIFKAMFAASKAFAIADSIIKIEQAIANAATIGFPANIGAMATVTAQTAGIVSTISGTQMQGMAHDGMDYIPQEGTWLLDKGERVVDSRTNADLKNYLSNQHGGVAANETIMIAPQINVEAGAGQDADEQLAEEISDNVYARVLEDINTNGPIRRAIG